MLFEIARTDAIIFCVLATLLAGVAVLACLAPALRATRVGPEVVMGSSGTTRALRSTAVRGRSPPGHLVRTAGELRREIQKQGQKY